MALYWGDYRVILGLYWGYIRVTLGFYWDNGKDNGNYHLGLRAYAVMGKCTYGAPGTSERLKAWVPNVGPQPFLNPTAV